MSAIPITTLAGGARLPMLYMGAGNFTEWMQMAGKGAGVKTAWSYHNQPGILPQVYAAGFAREDVFLEYAKARNLEDHSCQLSLDPPATGPWFHAASSTIPNL